MFIETLPKPIWVGLSAHPVLWLAYHITQELQEPKIELADLRPLVKRNQRPSRSGAIFLQASTKPCTAPTDLSKASRSLPASSISTTRSTPSHPLSKGTAP